MRLDVEYNNILASDLHLIVSRGIEVPAPEEKYTEYEVNGRDGILYEYDGTYKDIEISIPFNYVEYQNPGLIYRAAKEWLLTEGNSILRLEQFSDCFYKVKRIQVGKESRESLHVGEFTATFICDPFTYLNYGQVPVLVENGKISNPYMISHPLYLIEGEGMCVLMVNERSMTVNVRQNVTIDTNLFISYRTDGELVNTSVAGDYEDLYLRHGENAISVTDGFKLQIVPNWRMR